MAQSKYIKAVQKAAKGRPKSTQWYREKIKEFGTPKAMDLIRDGKQATRPFFGKMNMFIYAPKFAKKLPYYDTFPLVLPLERYSDGFLGINLHYLPIPLRIGLLDRLVDFSKNEKFDESAGILDELIESNNYDLVPFFADLFENDTNYEFSTSSDEVNLADDSIYLQDHIQQ